MNRQTSGWYWGASVSALALVTAVPLAVNFISLSPNVAIAILAGISTLALAISGLIGTIITGSRPVKKEDRKEYLAIRLIEIIGAIEKYSYLRRQLEAGDDFTPRMLPLREIMNQFVGEGIWSERDIVGFDGVLRTRNLIVHGDMEQVDAEMLSESVEKAARLLALIPGSSSRD